MDSILNNLWMEKNRIEKSGKTKKLLTTYMYENRIRR